MFSKTCQYALRALIYIAQKSQNRERLGVAEVARGIDSPERFMAKILQDMSRRGFVTSVKGPKGGFYMTEKNRNTRLSEVVRAIEGDKLFTGCALGLAQCSEKNPCPLHDEFMHIRKMLCQLLEGATLESFVTDLEMQKTVLISV